MKTGSTFRWVVATCAVSLAAGLGACSGDDAKDGNDGGAGGDDHGSGGQTSGGASSGGQNSGGSPSGGSNAGGEGGQLPDGTFQHSPSVTARWDETEWIIDVFAVNEDNLVVHRSFAADEWSDWSEAGEDEVSSSVDSTSWGTGRLDVVSRDADDAIAHKFLATGDWSDDAQGLGVEPPAVLVSDPAIVSIAPFRVWTFFSEAEEVEGEGSVIFGYYYAGSSWLPAKEIVGDGFISALDASAVVIDGGEEGAFAVAGLTTDHQYVTYATIDDLDSTTNTTGWGATELPELDGGFRSAPCITHDDTTVHYLGIDNDGVLRHIEDDTTIEDGFSEWTEVGEGLVGDPDCAFADDTLWVIARTETNALAYRTRTDGSWSSWQYLTED